MKTQTSTSQSIFGVVGKRTLNLALIILPLAAIASIGFFIWNLEGRSLLTVAKFPHWLWVALLFSFLPWITNSLRLMIWARFFELQLSLYQIFRIILGTVLGNAVTPTATGATAVKWAFLVNEDVTPDRATTLIGIQTAEDSFVSIILLAVAIIAVISFEVPMLLPDVDWWSSASLVLQRVASVVVIALVVTAVVITCVLVGLVGSKAKHASHTLIDRMRSMFNHAAKDWKYAFRSGRKYLLASTFLAVLQWTTRHSIAGLIIGFVGGQMMPMLHWVLQWLVITASSVIPSPGGAGGTEASFLLFFAPFLSGELLGSTMVTWRATIFYIPVAIAGLVFLVLGWHKPVRDISIKC